MVVFLKELFTQKKSADDKKMQNDLGCKEDIQVQFTFNYHKDLDKDSLLFADDILTLFMKILD